jgi:hypothetical protein
MPIWSVLKDSALVKAGKKDTWALSLSSLTTGKGLNVYTSISPEQASDCRELKTAVLNR